MGDASGARSHRRAGSRFPPALLRARGSFAYSAHRSSGLWAIIIFPMTRALQSVRNLLRHVIFIVLGEDRVRPERAGYIECAFRHDALTFAEKVRQHALIIDRDSVLAVGYLKAHRHIVSAHEAAILDQAAEPDARSCGYVFFHDIAGRIEEHDGIAKGIKHQRNREPKHRHRTTDQYEASLFASHPGLVLA